MNRPYENESPNPADPSEGRMVVASSWALIVALLPDAHEMRGRTYASDGECADRSFDVGVFPE